MGSSCAAGVRVAIPCRPCHVPISCGGILMKLRSTLVGGLLHGMLGAGGRVGPWPKALAATWRREGALPCWGCNCAPSTDEAIENIQRLVSVIVDRAQAAPPFRSSDLAWNQMPQRLTRGMSQLHAAAYTYTFYSNCISSISGYARECWPRF